MKWIVGSTTKAAKQAELLPEDAFLSLQVLFENLQTKGPNPGPHWPHYSKLQGTKKNIDKRHCHILKGRPTYVCCWEVFQTKRIIKVYYVGTHEKAPY
jgi:hypothetical protein